MKFLLPSVSKPFSIKDIAQVEKDIADAEVVAEIVAEIVAKPEIEQLEKQVLAEIELNPGVKASSEVADMLQVKIGVEVEVPAVPEVEVPTVPEVEVEVPAVLKVEVEVPFFSVMYFNILT